MSLSELSSCTTMGDIENAKTASFYGAKAKRILILGNRIGMFKGETGGGSIFRAQMVKTLSENHPIDSISLETDHIDMIEGSRGPMMTMTWSNVLRVVQGVLANDVIIQSGSYTPLTTICAYISLLTGTTCHTFITMNSAIACNTNYKGMNWVVAYVLYLSSDYLNGFLSTSTWTRSAEFLTSLQKMWVPVQGVVYLDSQYDVFRCADDDEDIEGVRNLLTLGKTGLPVMLYVGRIVKEKRIELLIENKPKDALLVILGGGPHCPAIAKCHDPSNNIICHVGSMLPQEYIRQCYKACDIMVSASNFETLGNTVMESLLCGNPVIVENAGGYKAQVVNGQNGWLVDWTNAGQVADAFNRIMKEGVSDLRPLKNATSRSVQDIVQAAPSSSPRSIRTFTRILVAVAFLPLMLLYVLLVWLWFLLGSP